MITKNLFTLKTNILKKSVINPQILKHQSYKWEEGITKRMRQLRVYINQYNKLYLNISHFSDIPRIQYDMTFKGFREFKRLRQKEFLREIIVNHDIDDKLKLGYTPKQYYEQIDNLYHEIVWEVLKRYPVYYYYKVIIDVEKLDNSIFLGKYYINFIIFI